MGEFIGGDRARESKLEQQQQGELGDLQRKEAKRRREIGEQRVRSLKAGSRRSLFDLADVSQGTSRTDTLG